MNRDFPSASTRSSEQALFRSSTMRWNRKCVAYLFAISLTCAGLLLALSDSAWTQEAKKANAQVKELQKQRLALLEHARDIATALFRNARLSHEEFLTAEREFLAAQIEYAETRDDRIKACDAAIEAATKCVTILESRKENVQTTELAVIKAKAYLLETKILRQKLESGD